MRKREPHPDDPNSDRHAGGAAVGSDGRPGRRLAVLVDAENVFPAFALCILAEAMKRGVVEIRRAFGAVALGGWDGVLVRHAFDAVAQRPRTGGRNAADIELAIAAMDLLHDDRIGGFAIACCQEAKWPLFYAV